MTDEAIGGAVCRCRAIVVWAFPFEVGVTGCGAGDSEG